MATDHYYDRGYQDRLPGGKDRPLQLGYETYAALIWAVQRASCHPLNPTEMNEALFIELVQRIPGVRHLGYAAQMTYGIPPPRRHIAMVPGAETCSQCDRVWMPDEHNCCEAWCSPFRPFVFDKAGYEETARAIELKQFAGAR